MKRILLILLILTNYVCFAAEEMANDLLTGQRIVKETAICDSYESCLKLGMQDRDDKKDSVLLYFSSINSDVKYNFFENLTVKLSANICPPLVSVYKSVNNINFLMDVFKKTGSGECISFYSNITGDGKNRDSVVGQLEIVYCNQDILYETCDNGIIYSKLNIFNQSKEKKKTPAAENRLNSGQNNGMNGQGLPSADYFSPIYMPNMQ